MKKTELESLINSIIPKLYSFAYAMIQDEEQAEQLIVDSYSVFLVREKHFISEYEFNNSKKDTVSIKRYLLLNMIREIFKLGTQRSSQLKSLKSVAHNEYDSFYKLNSTQRAVLLLKENLKFSIEVIQEALSIEKHQVIEQLYNSRHKLLEIESTDHNGTF